MKFYFVILCVLIFGSDIVKSQSLDDFYDKQPYGFYYRYTHIDHLPVLRDTSYSYNYGFIFVDLRRSRAKTGAFYFHWDPAGLNDFFRIIFGNPFSLKSQMMHHTVLSSGIIGWWNLGVNIIGTDYFVLSSGLNFSDFSVNTRKKFSVNPATLSQNPASLSHGTHLSIGPFANADYLLAKWLGARCGINYNFSFAQYYHEWINVKKPHFLVITPEVFTKFGLFFKMGFVSLKSRADDLKINRREMLLGWRMHF